MRLQLTDGYYLKFDQFSRILQYALTQINKTRISSNEYRDSLGMTEKLFAAYAKMMIEMGLLYGNKYILTEYGFCISKYDPYFAKKSTLWICHYIISSEENNYVWYRFINKILPSMRNYDLEKFYSFYDDVSNYNIGISAKKNTHKEVKSLINAYIEQDFRHLNLFYQDSDKRYSKYEHEIIDSLSFLYCLLHYRDKNNINSITFTFDEILNQDYSPGKVLHLENYELNEIINELHNKELLRIERFGDLNQIRLSEKIDKNVILQKIYN